MFVCLYVLVYRREPRRISPPVPRDAEARGEHVPSRRPQPPDHAEGSALFVVAHWLDGAVRHWLSEESPMPASLSTVAGRLT